MIMPTYRPKDQGWKHTVMHIHPVIPELPLRTTSLEICCSVLFIQCSKFRLFGGDLKKC